ncbi:MAG: SGNH/GDSL hydrolase family protein [Methylococcales bacterium]
MNNRTQAARLLRLTAGTGGALLAMWCALFPARSHGLAENSLYAASEALLWKGGYWLTFAAAVFACLRIVVQRKLTIVIFWNVVVVSAVYELLIIWMLAHPTALANVPSNLLAHLRRIDINQRDIPLYLHERFDPWVSYLYNAGEIRHREREFDVTYFINSLGVRDDEQSLNAPEVVVLGDSHAFGWGVPQHGTFAQLLESGLGTPVFNAGVGSYGTVREMRLLERIDTSRLKYLIVQYCSNDDPENRQFLLKDTIEISAPEVRAKVRSDYIRIQTYYPGKYSWLLIRKLLVEVYRAEAQFHSVLRPASAIRNENEQLLTDAVRAFIHAIYKAGSTPLEGIQIVVLDLHPFGNVRPEFARLVDEIKTDSLYPEQIQRIIALRFADKLTTDDYFILDDHINARGHELIAEELAKVVRLPAAD